MNENQKRGRGCKVNMKDRTITLTKAFSKQAGIYNTDEFRYLKEIRTEFPNFEMVFITVKPSKKTHKGLTIEWMEQYIENHDNRDEIKPLFKNIKDASKDMKGYFPIMKKWFFSQFPELTADVIREEQRAEAEMIALLESQGHTLYEAKRKVNNTKKNDTISSMDRNVILNGEDVSA